ncbi:shikimate dehydrogenase [Halothece sp. PCC 7418]|uniref:shikimate dehydrogenase n=1 Tax=Halothece sp. (strain PCC 7418) TaxID=65093 RepID=UPI0002A07AD0|nr:shikimate dehydrogenase [Halothece sp. PCC 7418]AFZ42930.1 shikimate dehydrogenase [Halothece sp. PCC 7418]
MITGKTKLLGVIGDPVEHSLSPVMHNAVLNHLGLDYVYLPLPVKKGDLERALAGFTAIDLVGFNATIPHKQAIIPYLNRITPEAQQVGAVNTVWRTEAGWEGTNTDVDGFIAPLKSLDQDWSNITPVILGNGGAARAVIVGCAKLGCSEIAVVGRNQEKLEQFKSSWANTGVSAAIKTYLWEELPHLVSQTQLLVNTTPIGMSPDADASPVEREILKELPNCAIAYDLIYTPRPTRLLQLAQDNANAVTFDGLEMLIQQGAAALEIWLQQPIPVEIMRSALNK